MTTAKDVAELAQTSTAVVSYVMNGGPRPVAAATRTRVLEAARALNYRPNAIARALSSGRTDALGLIIPQIHNPYFASLAENLERVARRTNHLLVVGDSAGDAAQEDAHSDSFVRQRRVDGVILVSVRSRPHLSTYDESGIPVVALHPLPADMAGISLSIDFAAAAETSIVHLAGHGYRSIGLLTAGDDSPGTHEHLRGVERACRNTPGITLDHRACDVSRFAASESAYRWLAERDPPRAIYCATDEQAFGVLFAAWRLGLSVPDDVAVVGFDGTAECAISIPPLASVRQPIGEIAELAVSILLTSGRATLSADTRIPPAKSRSDLPFEFVPNVSCGCESPLP